MLRSGRVKMIFQFKKLNLNSEYFVKMVRYEHFKTARRQKQDKIFAWTYNPMYLDLHWTLYLCHRCGCFPLVKPELLAAGCFADATWNRKLLK